MALLCDPGIRDEIAHSGSNPDTLVDLYIDSINQAVAECPADVVIGVHMCRGNFKGHYLGAGGYESVAERFFANTKVNHFLLEYDTARAGDFAPLRFVPKNKGVVLGLVSSKTPVLESLDVSEAADRGSDALYRSRSAGDRSAMRFRQHGRGQSAYRGRRTGKARVDRRSGQCDLALMRLGPNQHSKLRLGSLRSSYRC